MPGDLSIEALGVPFRISLGAGIDHESAAHLREIWSAARVDSTDSARVYRASIEPDWKPAQADPKSFVARDLRSLESTLSSRITLAAIEERKHDLVMLHGCAVARDDGAVYAFVGPSGRGKSTLARSLARVSHYVSDETVGIDEEGRVHPHAKPLSIIDPDALDGLKTQVSPASLGLRGSGTRDLRISRIFLLDRRPDAAGVSIDPITLADSLEHLVPQLSYLPSLPRPLHRIAELYDRTGGFAVLSYSEADDITAAFADGMLDASNASGFSTTTPVDLPSHPFPGGSAGYRRIPAIDALVAENGRLCLLHGSSVTVLDGIGPSVWALTGSPIAFDDLVERVVELHGEPPSGEAAGLVGATVRELVEGGVLEELPTHVER
ncbi:hypothetical protein [Herbiconiux ginsengi]|uniref:Coenzyme PQQ synthesis protein D (PqqD) n=1 Tax=Herbiconiux ginsengi TaxID=381665 RepID=A0A1H3U4W7_9MICO|nr:hypothetical protein [Herbiconiux ginsengi]SDZ57516.1 hypothetical protein SAMN05216554_0138 [Herbiconiux ginsengi]